MQNSYNIQIADTNGTRVTWAPAALITGDKVSFHRCRFRGIQDTLGDSQGRHYFQNCYISGVIDFIWGHGQSVYKVKQTTYYSKLNRRFHLNVHSCTLSHNPPADRTTELPRGDRSLLDWPGRLYHSARPRKRRRPERICVHKRPGDRRRPHVSRESMAAVLESPILRNGHDWRRQA